MSGLIHRLASMKLALGLLFIIIVAMAVGTVIESSQGRDAAMQKVYTSAWFHLMLGAFALNLICSIVDRWPWHRGHVGFLMTHTSLLLILVGALVTDQFKLEGRLGIWEGQTEAVIALAEPVDEKYTLPFSVRLDSFEIDYYPGTRRPAMYRSRVTVEDPAAGRSFPAVIEMNHELAYGGFKFFQSSYQQTPRGEMTILTVSRDPGGRIVFAGYFLMLIGMCTVLTKRIRARRQVKPQPGKPRKQKVRSRAAALLAGLLCGSLLVSGALAGAVPDTQTVETLRGLPVQHDGRVMPLDTVAREAVWKVTGKTTWNEQGPVAVVLGWSFDPQHWAAEKIIPVDTEVALAMGLPAHSGLVSFMDVVDSAQARSLFAKARHAQQADQPLVFPMKEAQKMEARLVVMQPFLERTIYRVTPTSSNPQEAWAGPPHLVSVDDLVRLQQNAPAEVAALADAMDREILYNQVRPSRLAWWILLPSTIISILAWRQGRRWMDVLAVGGLFAGFVTMTWGLATRWAIAGRIPASNMYESLLFLGWGVALFALIAVIFFKNRLVVFNATAMATLTMMLTDLLPVDPFIHPMPPVLSGTPWLAIHVPIIMVSYSVLTLGVLIAHMQIGVQIFSPQREALAARMNDLLYWYIHIGSILLIAGILTGSIWAASSWGRYWGWDPKEVWSLIAFLAYLGILHGRLDRVFGSFGVAVLSIVAFWTIVMTYIGVNYILAAGLHSYGFGGSGIARWMMIVASFEAAFLLAGVMAHRRQAAPVAAHA